jgi:hypothetical protein
MNIPIVPIVEGDGEVAAVPLLLRRMAAEIWPQHWIEVPNPIRVSRDKLLKTNQLERYYEFAAKKASSGGVLILLDAEIG